MPLLEASGIRKQFGGVVALAGAQLSLEAGEVHALIGSNGCGKSTLCKIIAGSVAANAGTLQLDGRKVSFSDPQQAAAAGIGVFYQELYLAPNRSVAENIFLGREPARLGVVNWSELYHRASNLLNDLNLPIDPSVEVGSLGIGQQQLVEIAKALSQNARILVLDEPTAALTESEVETLFGILRKLTARGVGIIYISHKLDEVFAMADRITVLRDGKTVGTNAASELTGRVLGADSEAARRSRTRLADIRADHHAAAA